LVEFRPDLVVLINHTRADVGGVFPQSLPVVSWVQDAMPHLFRDTSGCAIGPIDMVVGHLHADFLARCGYPRDRLLYSPVVASADKLHEGAIDRELLER